jgi:hypothetical protein
MRVLTPRGAQQRLDPCGELLPADASTVAGECGLRAART